MIKNITDFFKKVHWRYEILTLANILTLARLALTPFLAYAIAAKSWIIALILLVFAGISDILDGYLARRWHESTTLGRILDPIADKCLLVTCFVTLAVKQSASLHIPYWFVMLIIVRELMLIAGSLVLLARQVCSADNLEAIAPTWWGKLTTFFQLIFIGWLFICYFFSWQPEHTYTVMLACITLFSMVSFAQYVRLGFSYLSRLW